MGYLEYRRLQTYNSAGRELRLRRKLLIYGTCVRDEYPRILSDFSKGRVALAVCLEEEHFNMVGLKLASIVARVPLEELVILTVDGSPHCVQLHHLAEEVHKVAKNCPEPQHFVIEGGEAVKVDRKAVKLARYLSKVSKILGSA
ncbi:MAG: 4Fe-4S ferredoxin [Thermofilum sp. ex4484_15]|nr:MAG: 4Fe-4S ferredoxin [Thermofilum sp. ex4484_15]